MVRVLALIFLLFTPALALADVGIGTSTTGLPPINTGEDALGLLSPLLKAFEAKDWALFAGLLLSGLIFGLRQLQIGKKIPDELVPWAAVLIAVLTSVAAGLAAHQPAGNVIWTGLLVGVASVGSWELIVKNLRDLVRRVRGGAA